MHWFRALRRGVRWLAWAAAGWAMTAAPLWAAARKPAEPEEPAKPGSGVWVMAYALVFLFITLGLMFLLRPSGRRDRAKPEQYGE